MITVNNEIKTHLELIEEYPYKWVVLENYTTDATHKLIKGELIYV